MNNKKEVRVAFYLRVSTELQETDGYGLDYQLSALNDLIKFKAIQEEKRINKPEWQFTDVSSGGNLKREAYKKMLETVKRKEFDVVAVWKIDRMSRNLTHLLNTFEEFKKYGVSFYSIKENIDFSGPVGRLTFQMFGALAEFEREMIRVRTTEGKKESAKKGNYIGSGIPYGYKKENEAKKGGKLIIVKKEAEYIKQIFNWFIIDNLNYSDIANKLNDLNVPKGVASRGKDKYTKWSGTKIKDKLINPTYIGERYEHFKDEKGNIDIVKVSVPQIIDKDIFNFTQIKIQELDAGKNAGGGENSYLLSRKIKDLQTGKTLTGYVRENKTHGYRRKGYTDKNGIKYQNIEIPGETIDSFIWDKVETFLHNPDLFYKNYVLSTENKEGELEKLTDKRDFNKAEIKKQNQIIENVETDFYAGNIDIEKRDKYINRAEKQISDLEQESYKLDNEIENILKLKVSKQIIDKLSHQFGEKVREFNFEQKKYYIDLLVDKIIITNDDNIKVDIYFRFDPGNEVKKNDSLELKKSILISEKDASNSSLLSNGRRRGTRTHNPTLPKRVR